MRTSNIFRYGFVSETVFPIGNRQGGIARIRWCELKVNCFVYGTLRAGEVNDIRAAAAKHNMSAPVFIGTAAVSGRLYDFGSYPGLVLDTGGIPVVGEVYEVEDALIGVLDEIERVYPGVDELFGGGEVDLEVGNSVVLCRLYPVSRDAVVGLTEILRGDWIVHRRMRTTA